MSACVFCRCVPSVYSFVCPCALSLLVECVLLCETGFRRNHSHADYVKLHAHLIASHGSFNCVILLHVRIVQKKKKVLIEESKAKRKKKEWVVGHMTKVLPPPLPRLPFLHSLLFLSPPSFSLSLSRSCLFVCTNARYFAFQFVCFTYARVCRCRCRCRCLVSVSGSVSVSVSVSVL